MSTKKERRLALYKLIYESTHDELREMQQVIARALASCEAPAQDRKAQIDEVARKLQTASTDELQTMAQVIGAKPAER